MNATPWIKKSKRNIRYIVVHCTATPEGRNHTVADVRRWHRSMGWKDIGYNYLIQLDGTMQNGRDVDLVPAHVSGYNKESIGVVYVGGCDQEMKPKDTRTTAQIQSLLKLLTILKKTYPEAEILGHRDFPGVNKACPSFNAKTEYQNL
jgi:N-acetylmuramoyl-L-alanine amidase